MRGWGVGGRRKQQQFRLLNNDGVSSAAQSSISIYSRLLPERKKTCVRLVNEVIESTNDQ